MTKFRDLLHAKAFIARGLELHIITEDQVDQVMECKIRITHELGFIPISDTPSDVIPWHSAGIAGRMLEKISSHDETWRAISPTTTLPIVKPCHRCGESHDEANPPPRCAETLAKVERIDWTPTALLAEISEKDRRIAGIEAENRALKNELSKDRQLWRELDEYYRRNG